LLKAAMALHQRILPPTAQITTPNPKMEFGSSKLYPNPIARPWIRGKDHPRRAGVSAFGFGGSNFHLALEEHGDPDAVVPTVAADEQLFLFSADDADGLVARLSATEAATEPTLAHLARAVLAAWKPGRRVVAFTATSLDEAHRRLGVAKKLAAGGCPAEQDGVHHGVPTDSDRQIAVVFPGQGSQYVEMGRSLLLRHATARAALDRADDSFRRAGRPPLSEVVFPPPAFDEPTRAAQQATLTRTEFAQPAIGALSKGLYDLLVRFGVRPTAVAGHSYGELVALCAAGVINEESLWTASRLRGEAMADHGSDRGTMAAVSGPLDEIAGVLGRLTDGVVLANRNHPRQGVISGSRVGISRALAALGEAKLAGKEIPVSAAFHSSLVADASAPFAAALEALPFSAPRLPVLSTTTAADYPADTAGCRALLARQITSPVDFVGIVANLFSRGIRTFVECGPRGVLTGLIRQCLKGDPSVAIVALDRDEGRVDGDAQLKRALAALAARGVAVDVTALLAEPLPPLPRVAGSKATVWLGGPNYLRPETRNPAPPPADPASRAKGAPMSETRAPSTSQPAASVTPSAPSAVSMPDGDVLGALLESTRSSLAAFQQAQERTALVHTEFLRAHAKANDSFTSLFATHARLVELAAGGVPMALPSAPIAVSAPPPPAVAAPPASPPDAHGAVSRSFLMNSYTSPELAEQYGRVAAPAPARPAVAAAGDLPPQLSANAEVHLPRVDARATAPAIAPATPRPPGHRADLVAAMLTTVADKTGYPADMLELGMDMEADLGIDSIKRVEILAGVQERVPGLPELDNDALSALRTLGEVVAHLEGLLPQELPAPVRASVSPPRAARAADFVLRAMMRTVAEKTGYPEDTLEVHMDLESDLGIDSIKRVEIFAAVQEQIPGLPELDNDRLSSLRTLGEVVAHLEALGSADAAPRAEEAPPFSADAVRQAMMRTVAEKTGYPEDMLELQMDMESDLGIDSIKRVEILAAVQELIPGLPELDSDRLAALRTLGDIVGHLAERAGPPSGQTAATASAPVAARAIVARKVAVVAAAPAGRTAPLTGRVLVSSDRLRVGERLVDALRARGCDAAVFDPEAPLSGPVHALVYTAALDRSGEGLRAAVRRAFLLARSAGPCALFATVSGQGGFFGFQDRVGAAMGGALAGLPKTLAQEWEGSRCLAIDIDPARVDIDALADTLVTDRGVVEVGLAPDRAGAVTIVARPEALSPAQVSAPIDPGDLVVVSGGGRGVTAAVVVEMARRWRPALLLLGRSAIPESDPIWASGVEDGDLKNARMRAARAVGEKLAPKDLERETGAVEAAREVRATLDAARSAGGTARYAAVDVCSAEDVAHAVAFAVAAHGPVRGVVHAAGVIADKLALDKTPEQFDAVFGTKVDGLDALLGAVDLSALRVVALFGSVAGRYGNRGQCDYAMANEALAKQALWLEGSLDARARVRCFDWGPWEAGMVTPALRKQLEARGMPLIGRTAGAAAFCDELERAQGPIEIVLGGPETSGPLVDTRPASAGSIVHRLTASGDRFLNEHRIAGKAVLPAAMVIEWMAQAARVAFPSLHLLAVRGFAILKGVVVEDGTPAAEGATVEMRWQEVPGVGSHRALSVELLRHGVAHYRAVLDLGERGGSTTKFPGSNGLGEKQYPYSVDEAYRRFLFHGPGMRGIDEVVGISDHGMVARLRTSVPASLGVDVAAWETDPIAVDSALQLMLLWVREKRGAAALPCYLGEYRQHAPFRGGITCHLEMAPTATAHGRFRASFVDAEGQVVATMTDGEYAANPALNSSFHG
jgi:acyl transferase domain-containing protein/NADP-dependent 3-hydroxy acid dehydrogenase YdfG